MPGQPGLEDEHQLEGDLAVEKQDAVVVDVDRRLLVVVDAGVAGDGAVVAGPRGTEKRLDYGLPHRVVELVVSPDGKVDLPKARLLAEVGPPARSALPEVRKLLCDSDPETRQLAREALDSIDAQDIANRGCSFWNKGLRRRAAVTPWLKRGR